VAGGVGLEFGSVEDGETGLEAGEVGGLRANEHVPHEQRVPRARRDEADREPECRVRAAEQILDEQLAGVEEGADVGVQPIERVGLHAPVLGPPDAFLRLGIRHDELVFG
jgi:hypothetical protein